MRRLFKGYPAIFPALSWFLRIMIFTLWILKCRVYFLYILEFELNIKKIVLFFCFPKGEIMLLKSCSNSI